MFVTHFMLKIFSASLSTPDFMSRSSFESVAKLGALLTWEGVGRVGEERKGGGGKRGRVVRHWETFMFRYMYTRHNRLHLLQVTMVLTDHPGRYRSPGFQRTGSFLPVFCLADTLGMSGPGVERSPTWSSR